MTSREPSGPVPEPDAHRAGTTEDGSFCTARCRCGWAGPARRSRDRARRDAAEHLTSLRPGPVTDP
ncbi:hypothetical protein AQ490_02395 [Wenjunlia vitaminophila]|uniref:Uncharacterized protein n=1 Tax=Wenjunlia vitaminophila TaxID=76728 RepID=A0A0T6LYW3_WENVI|nr:hypothetical protein [Wenjunlia vitaminophila]KRV51189.1 hypothetical protein AQ490_02395 [Wenjunlia vitaminophila]